jgi:hypothetical protein
MAPAAEAVSRTPVGRQVKLRCEGGTCASDVPAAPEHEDGRCSKTRTKRHGGFRIPTEKSRRDFLLCHHFAS